MSLVMPGYRWRKPEATDVEAIYAYRNAAAVTSGVGGFSTGMSRADVLSWIDHHRTSRNTEVWVIADPETNEAVGHGGYYAIDYRRGKAELGLALAPSQHGRGQGGRCLAYLCDYAFKQLRLHRLETFNLATNGKIVTIKTGLGFALEGTMRDYQFKDGEYVDVNVMAILAPEWRGVPEKYR